MQLRNTIIALLVAAAFLAFALKWKAEIIVVGVIAAVWIGFAWLIRRHPYVAIFLVSFLRGLFRTR